MSDDPVLARRARIARLTELGQRVGYGLFGSRSCCSSSASSVGYSGPLVTIIVVSLGVGSAVLAAAIVFAYAVRAAEREDRELGR